MKNNLGDIVFSIVINRLGEAKAKAESSRLIARLFIFFSSFLFPAPLYHTEAVQGSMALLPCNITPPMFEDKVSLVIWYKEGQTTPIYSFDLRDSHLLDSGSHHEGNGSLNGRSHFNTTVSPAVFIISHTKSYDNGLYRCRVDFLKSPTRNIKIQLSVIGKEMNLFLLDGQGVLDSTTLFKICTNFLL
jgi:neural cell adhesion molecule